MKIFEQQKDQLYTNNESKLSGLYPLGKGSFWHSGIHLHLDSPITTAFEGDVVAYYIADKYQVNSKGKNVSKSFVLMRHNINLMKGSENTENSQIEFFSLYTSLLPDSEMKVVKDFKESKELTNSNKNMNLPFYKDVKFTINQSKCNSYRKLKNDDFYVGARGNIVDGSYLTKRKLEDKNNIQLGNKKIVLPLKAVKLENSDKYYDVKVEKDSVEYFPVNTDSKIFSPRGTIKVGTVFCCSTEPTVVKNENYYKIKSNGKILKNKEKSGYIFQCETYKNNPSSDYAYVNEKLKYSILYDVTEIEDRKNFFFICKYSELKKFITDVNNISGIKAFFANLGFGINKEQLNRDITENIKLKSSKEEYKDDDIIFICNNKYDWNDNKISKDRVKQIFYDISFKNKLSSYAIFYVSEKVYGDISNNVKEYSEKSLNLVKLSAIKENQEQFACSIESENVEIDSKNNISLLTNNLLYHVKTHLPTSYDTEWLVKGSDLTLLSGPDVVLVDDGKSFTNTAKGLMLYDKNNKKSPCLLIDKESDSFIVSDYKSFIENSNNDLQLINYNGTEYYVNVSGVEQLKAQVINKIGFSVDSVIKPSGDNSIFLSKDRVLGFASEKDGTKSFDFITFTKDSSFFDTKDKLIVRIPKENAEIRSVAKKSNKTIQRLPYKSTLKIIGKEEIFGHYYYKVKYYLMPVWFSKESLTAKGNKYTIKEDIDSVWISFLKIKSDGKCSGENSWASNEQISLLKDLISNNFETFRGKEFSFIEKNNEGSSYSLAVDFESVSGTYYIDDISNFTLNEKEQILTIQKRTKDFTLYETVPFVVEKVSDSKQIKSICDSYNCDEGALLKYETGEYYSLVKKDSNVNPDKDYYIKKTDIEEKNLLDWNEYFKLYDKDSDDDVFYDLTDFLDSCGIEKDILENLKTKLNKVSGRDKLQKKLIEIYTDEKVKKHLRRLIVKHPLEFNETLYKEEEIKKRTPSENIAKNFVEDMKLVSFWKDVSDIKGIDNTTSLYFSHPVTFFNRIDEIKDKTVPFLYEKWGSKITGKNGNIFILDNGKGKLLSNVEWYDQRDNLGDSTKGVYGYNMCQLTSLAMVMNAMGVKRKRSDVQFEDELYNIANLAGYGGSKLWEETTKVYNEVLKKYAEGYDYVSLYLDSVSDEIKIKKIKEQIDKNVPILKSIDYKEDGNSGHVIVIVGYIDDCLIVNDPYGDVNTGYKEHNGAFVKYKTNRWWITKKWAGILD